MGIVLDFMNAVSWETMVVQTVKLDRSTCVAIGSLGSYNVQVIYAMLVWFDMNISFNAVGFNHILHTHRAIHMAVQVSIWGLALRTRGLGVPSSKVILRDGTAVFGLMIGMF
jgi:hypothetical protein